jgi:hypothetical protein
VSATTTHIDWDRGVLAEVVDPLLAVELGGYSAATKTCTTQCGRQAAAAQTDNQAATCPACRAAVTKTALATLELLAAHPGSAPAQSTGWAGGCAAGRPGALPRPTQRTSRKALGPLTTGRHDREEQPMSDLDLSDCLVLVELGPDDWAAACGPCRQALYRGPSRVAAFAAIDAHTCTPDRATSPIDQRARWGREPGPCEGRPRPHRQPPSTQHPAEEGL